MIWTVNSILKSTSGQLIQGSGDLAVTKFEFDTRQIGNPESCLFVALAGSHKHGIGFLKVAYDMGIRLFLLDQEFSTNLPDATVIKVDDSLRALQEIARFHREYFEGDVVAITGSHGKTIVKEWASTLLEKKYKVCKSPHSYNSQLGVALSVLGLEENHDLGIFEAGISTTGEMQRLEEILQPRIGLFTTFGKAHLEGFDNDEERLQEKWKLFTRVKTLIVPHAELPTKLLDGFGGQVISFSGNGNSEADFFLKKENGQLMACYKTQCLVLKSGLKGKVALHNLAASITLALVSGLSLEEAQEAISRLAPLEMRMQLLQGREGIQIVNDTYNSDLDSISLALNFCKEQSPDGFDLILSDIEESGLDEAMRLESIAKLLQHFPIGNLYFLGSRKLEGSKHFLNKEAALEYFKTRSAKACFPNGFVLVKGARRFGLESIVALYEQKSHSAHLRVDLSALSENLRRFRKILPSSTGVLAMLKAYGYGAGSFEIARLLENQGVQYFGVAYPDEGIFLRQKGIGSPIMVMNPSSEELGRMLQFRLEPEVANFVVLDAMCSSPELSSIPIHLKLNSGMHRMGFDEDDLEMVLEKVEEAGLKVASIFSHLAASDEPSSDHFTEQQFGKFKLLAMRVEDRLGYATIKHIANSAATIRFPKMHLDMVRLGLGLHGVELVENFPLENVASLKARVSSLRWVKEGAQIGYGSNTIAERDVRVATLNVGYADGYDRRLGNGKGYVFYDGKMLPTVGNICMDLLMVDATGAPQLALEDEVILFGEQPSLAQLARWMGTVEYEVLSRISARTKRIYLKE